MTTSANAGGPPYKRSVKNYLIDSRFQLKYTGFIVAVTIVYLPRYVRLMRASALGELSKDYVTAARVVGVGLFRLMFFTILPNCLAP